MVKTKGLDATTEKWQRKVGQAGPDYQAGVNNPKKDWATETSKAEPRYKEGVTKAANEGRFGKGVNKAGTEKWRKGATGKEIPDKEGGAAAGIEFVRRLKKKINMDIKLSEFGVERKDIRKIIGGASSSSMSGNPGELTADVLEEMMTHLL